MTWTLTQKPDIRYIDTEKKKKERLEKRAEKKAGK